MKYSPNKLKQIMARFDGQSNRGYSIIGVWVATNDNPCPANPYVTPYFKGDVVVTRMGSDLGSIPWDTIAGNVLTNG